MFLAMLQNWPRKEVGINDLDILDYVTDDHLRIFEGNQRKIEEKLFLAKLGSWEEN